MRVPACKSVPPNLVRRRRPAACSSRSRARIWRRCSGPAGEVLGGFDKLRTLGREAILKGNYVQPQPYPVTTPADFVVAVSQALKRDGFERTTLFEAQGSRLVPAFAPEAGMRKVGVFDEVQRQGVEVLAADFFERDDFGSCATRPGRSRPPSPSTASIHEAPVLVSLPVVKRHGSARFTCALKMHFGSVAMADRLVAHKNERQQGYFDQRLVHFADAAKPQLNIVDARALLARSGPGLSAGSEVVRGRQPHRPVRRHGRDRRLLRAAAGAPRSDLRASR